MPPPTLVHLLSFEQNKFLDNRLHFVGRVRDTNAILRFQLQTPPSQPLAIGTSILIHATQKPPGLGSRGMTYEGISCEIAHTNGNGGATSSENAESPVKYARPF